MTDDEYEAYIDKLPAGARESMCRNRQMAAERRAYVDEIGRRSARLQRAHPELIGKYPGTLIPAWVYPLAWRGPPNQHHSDGPPRLESHREEEKLWTHEPWWKAQAAVRLAADRMAEQRCRQTEIEEAQVQKRREENEQWNIEPWWKGQASAHKAAETWHDQKRRQEEIESWKPWYENEFDAEMEDSETSSESSSFSNENDSGSSGWYGQGNARRSRQQSSSFRNDVKSRTQEYVQNLDTFQRPPINTGTNSHGDQTQRSNNSSFDRAPGQFNTPPHAQDIYGRKTGYDQSFPTASSHDRRHNTESQRHVSWAEQHLPASPAYSQEEKYREGRCDSPSRLKSCFKNGDITRPFDEDASANGVHMRGRDYTSRAGSPDSGRSRGQFMPARTAQNCAPSVNHSDTARGRGQAMAALMAQGFLKSVPPMPRGAGYWAMRSQELEPERHGPTNPRKATYREPQSQQAQGRARDADSWDYAANRQASSQGSHGGVNVGNVTDQFSTSRW